MSGHRKAPLPPNYRNVRPGICRWCDKPVLMVDGVTPTRLTWHTECVRAFKIIHWPAETRKAVYERDRGICARCGHDCERLKARYDHAAKWGGVRPDWVRWGMARHSDRKPDGISWNKWNEMFDTLQQQADARFRRIEKRYADRQPQLKAAAAKRIAAMGRGWGNGGWQHDHIRPLIEANGDLAFWQLSNIQTLCSACHVQKGKEDNRRRKLAQSNQATLAL